MSNLIKSPKPDYQKLREILEKQLCRPVPLHEAENIGKYLINTYDVLLGDEP